MKKDGKEEERMTCRVRKGQELGRKTEKEKENKKRKKRKKKWGADETERGRNNKRGMSAACEVGGLSFLPEALVPAPPFKPQP